MSGVGTHLLRNKEDEGRGGPLTCLENKDPLSRAGFNSSFFRFGSKPCWFPQHKTMGKIL